MLHCSRLEVTTEPLSPCDLIHPGVSAFTHQRVQEQQVPNTPYHQTSTTVSEKICNTFGYEPYDHQVKSLEKLLEGEDCILFAPTSAGKSLIPQSFPLFRDGWVLVIIPLTQLGLEQQAKVNNLPGLRAEFLYEQNNTQEFRQEVADQISRGIVTHLYTSPELATSTLFNKSFLRQASAQERLSLVVVDEVHLISQWGKGFRPSYYTLSWLKQRIPRTIPWFGASATLRTQCLEDIQRAQVFGGAHIVSIPIDRPSIFIEHRYLKTSLRSYADLFVLLPKSVPAGVPLLETLRRIPRTIVFLPTINDILAARNALLTELCMRGFPLHLVLTTVDMFYSHRSTPSKGRIAMAMSQDDSDTRIILATDAIGMGMDYQVDVVVQYGSKNLTLDMLVQRLGRAARRQGSRAFFLWLTLKATLSTRTQPSSTIPAPQSEPGPSQRTKKSRYRATQQAEAAKKLSSVTQEQQELEGIINNSICLRQSIMSPFLLPDQEQHPLPSRCCSKCHPGDALQCSIFQDLTLDTDSTNSLTQYQQRRRKEEDTFKDWKERPYPGFQIPENILASSRVQAHFLNNLYRWAEQKSCLVLQGACVPVTTAPHMIMSKATMKTLAKQCLGVISPAHLLCLQPSWSWGDRADYVLEVVRLAEQACDTINNRVNDIEFETITSRLIELGLWAQPSQKGVKSKDTASTRPSNKRVHVLKPTTNPRKRQNSVLLNDEQHHIKTSQSAITPSPSSNPRKRPYLPTPTLTVVNQTPTLSDLRHSQILTPRQIFPSALSQTWHVTETPSPNPSQDGTEMMLIAESQDPFLHTHHDLPSSIPTSHLPIPLTRSQTQSSFTESVSKIPDSQPSTLLEDTLLHSDDSIDIGTVAQAATAGTPCSKDTAVLTTSMQVPKQPHKSRQLRKPLAAKSINITSTPQHLVSKMGSQTRSGRRSKLSEKMIKNMAWGK